MEPTAKVERHPKAPSRTSSRRSNRKTRSQPVLNQPHASKSAQRTGEDTWQKGKDEGSSSEDHESLGASTSLMKNLPSLDRKRLEVKACTAYKLQQESRIQYILDHLMPECTESERLSGARAMHAVHVDFLNNSQLAKAIIFHLHDSNPEVRWRCLHKLQQLPSQLAEHESDIAKLIDDEKWEVRWMAYRSLCKISNRVGNFSNQIIYELSGRSVSHPMSTNAALELLMKLPRIQLVEHADTLAKICSSARSQVTRAKLFKLLRSIKHLTRDSEYYAQVGKLNVDIKSLCESPEQLDRELGMLMMVIHRVTDPKFDEMKLKMLMDPSNALMIRAARGIMRIDSKAGTLVADTLALKAGTLVADILAPQLHAEKDDRRIAVLKSLSATKNHSEKYWDEIAELIAVDVAATVRVQAMKTLSQFGSMRPAHIKTICMALADKDCEVRFQAATALQAMNERATQVILECLKDCTLDNTKRFLLMRGLSLMIELPVQVKCCFLLEWVRDRMPVEEKKDSLPIPVYGLEVRNEIPHQVANFPITCFQPEGQRNEDTIFFIMSKQRIADWEAHVMDFLETYKSAFCDQFYANQIQASVIESVYEEFVSKSSTIQQSICTCAGKPSGQSCGTRSHVVLCGYHTLGTFLLLVAISLLKIKADISNESANIDFDKLSIMTVGAPHIILNGEGPHEDPDRLRDYKALFSFIATHPKVEFAGSYSLEQDPVPAVTSKRFHHVQAHFIAEAARCCRTPGHIFDVLKRLNSRMNDSACFSEELSSALPQIPLNSLPAAVVAGILPNDKDAEQMIREIPEFETKMHAEKCYTAAVCHSVLNQLVADADSDDYESDQSSSATDDAEI